MYRFGDEVMTKNTFFMYKPLYKGPKKIETWNNATVTLHMGEMLHQINI